MISDFFKKNVLIKVIIILVILLAAFFIFWRLSQTESLSPVPTPTPTPTQEIVSNSPIDSLSDSLMEKLNIDCQNKMIYSDRAGCIMDWQEKNMFYCIKDAEAENDKDKFYAGYGDCQVDMQFNQMVLGSFPVSKVFELKTRDGKVFGNDYTFATTYCALARKMGLQCRVIQTPSIPESYLGNYGAGYCGSAPKSYIDKLGLDCNKLKSITWVNDVLHSWPEVYLENKWVIMEKSSWAYKDDTAKNIIGAQLEESFDSGW